MLFLVGNKNGMRLNGGKSVSESITIATNRFSGCKKENILLYLQNNYINSTNSSHKHIVIHW